MAMALCLAIRPYIEPPGLLTAGDGGRHLLLFQSGKGTGARVDNMSLSTGARVDNMSLSTGARVDNMSFSTGVHRRLRHSEQRSLESIKDDKVTLK